MRGGCACFPIVGWPAIALSRFTLAHNRASAVLLCVPALRVFTSLNQHGSSFTGSPLRRKNAGRGTGAKWQCRTGRSLGLFERAFQADSIWRCTTRNRKRQNHGNDQENTQCVGERTRLRRRRDWQCPLPVLLGIRATSEVSAQALAPHLSGSPNRLLGMRCRLSPEDKTRTDRGLQAMAVRHEAFACTAYVTLSNRAAVLRRDADVIPKGDNWLKV